MMNVRSLVSIAVLYMLVSAGCAAAAPPPSDSSPIQTLRALYEKDAAFRDTMNRALASVRDPDPDSADRWPNPRSMNPWKGKRFADLVAFFEDWYRLVPTPSGLQDEFNYIEQIAWFYYKNPDAQQVLVQDPWRRWTRDFVEARRRFLESKASTTTIAQWMADPSIRMDQYVVPPGGFQSFNQFFTRDLRPGTRTIAGPTDDSVLAAPTDCVVNMIQPLTSESKIPTKLNQQLNVNELLAGSAYAKYFEHGSAISCVLLPTTYHHYHAIASGTVVESRENVPGAYWGMKDFGRFYNRGNFGYGASYDDFARFHRGYVVIETKSHGHVAMIPVGLDTISSVVFEDKFKQVIPQHPVPIYKGDKIGHFAYGGSLVIMLVERGITNITIPQGQQIGVFRETAPTLE